jgi:hypothetical protein
VSYVQEIFESSTQIHKNNFNLKLCASATSCIVQLCLPAAKFDDGGIIDKLSQYQTQTIIYTR